MRTLQDVITEVTHSIQNTGFPLTDYDVEAIAAEVYDRTGGCHGGGELEEFWQIVQDHDRTINN